MMTTREQFLQSLRRYCRKNGIVLEIDTSQGKGSHYKLRAGGAFAVIQSGEIGPRYARTILKQRGLPKDAV
jgi:hypothetical protein